MPQKRQNGRRSMDWKDLRTVQQHNLGKFNYPVQGIRLAGVPAKILCLKDLGGMWFHEHLNVRTWHLEMNWYNSGQNGDHSNRLLCSILTTSHYYRIISCSYHRVESSCSYQIYSENSAWYSRFKVHYSSHSTTDGGTLLYCQFDVDASCHYISAVQDLPMKANPRPSLESAGARLREAALPHTITTDSDAVRMAEVEHFDEV